MPSYQLAYISELAAATQQDALLTAVQLLDTRAVSVLLSLDLPGAADPTTCNASGNTALHLLAIMDVVEINKQRTTQLSKETAMENFRLIFGMLLWNGASLEVHNNLQLSFLDLLKTQLCPEPRLHQMLVSLGQQLASLEAGSNEWLTVWSNWTTHKWSKVFPATDTQLPCGQDSPQRKHKWRLLSPSVTDITQDYNKAMLECHTILDCVASEHNTGFNDTEFPARDASLFIDAAQPCSEDWMSRPDTWARVAEIYPNSTVVNAAMPQPRNNLMQGGVGDRGLHCHQGSHCYQGSHEG